jgi:hypothetical protein
MSLLLLNCVIRGEEMRLSRALEEKNLDLRLRDKLTSEGKLTDEKLKRYIDSLPEEDCAYTEEETLEEKSE